MNRTLYGRISDNLKESQITSGVILLIVPITFCTYLFHEFGHWTLGELTGNEMTMSLNNSARKNGHFINEFHALLSAIEGPLFTILQAFIFWIVTKMTKSIYAFSVVFVAVFSRFFTVVLGGFRLQDEWGIASLLQVNEYLIAFIVLLILFMLLWGSSRIMKLNLKAIGYSITFGSFAMLIVIGLDGILNKL